MARLIGSVLTAAVLLAAAPATAEVVWRGDYESGDLSQWSKVQAVESNRLEIETSQVTQGRYALKATVIKGDDPIGASGNRNELAYMSYEASGSQRYYRWQTMFPEDYPITDTWQLFTQWHHSGPSGSPPVEFVVRGEEISLRVDGETVWKAPLVRGRWLDFIFHVKWSPDPSEGFVELYLDGKRVLEKTPARTQYPGELNYLKQGLYRDEKVKEKGVVYHDGMVIATDYEDVAPVPASSAASEVSEAKPLTPEEQAQLQEFAGATGCGGSVATGAPMLGAAFLLLGLARRQSARPRRHA